ncbi:sulfatase [Streptomyces sp. NPDC059175]|uniref:sulfatase n=1 Tax=Streptomyces sp. NPDC059175 TaxID=3346757 RepID=UPI00369E9A25
MDTDKTAEAERPDQDAGSPGRAPDGDVTATRAVPDDDDTTDPDTAPDDGTTASDTAPDDGTTASDTAPDDAPGAEPDCAGGRGDGAGRADGQVDSAGTEERAAEDRPDDSGPTPESDAAPDTERAPVAAERAADATTDTDTDTDDGPQPEAADVPKRPRLSRLTNVLAVALVFSALVLPNKSGYLSPGAFTRIPVEGLFGTALLLVVPPRTRRWAALVAGAGLSVLTVLKVLDIGFYSVLNRPFDLVLDWVLFDDATSFLEDSVGRAGAIGAEVGAVLVVVALLVLVTLAVVRVSRLVERNRAVATQGTLILGTVWVACAALGVQTTHTGLPLASRTTADLALERVHHVRAGLRDKGEFAKESSVDAFRNTPPDKLLTGLRGKDVIFTFIESYGRSAVQDPAMASQVGEVLANGTERLRAAGFSSRSAFLTSPTYGGGSWLAHSTFNSGLWIKNQQRYRSLTSSDRMTLTSAFRKTGAWRTVGIMPGVTRSWPEGRFYGLDHVYDSRDLGYQGPKFSWTPVPDQYSLSAFERLEHGKQGRKPMMAEIILASSHNPWAPIPRMIGWNEVGDGSVYEAIKDEGKDPQEVWKDPDQVRDEYRRAIEYSLNSLITYVEKYGDENTVLVFLGDHQPVSTVTRGRLGRDVPVAIVARDPAVLDRIADWGWQDGLKPGPKAPVWQMDAFRDRFLSAYGSTPGAAAAPSPARPSPTPTPSGAASVRPSSSTLPAPLDR